MLSPKSRDRRPVRPSPKHRRRRLASELLERRELLAAQIGTDLSFSSDPIVEAAFVRAANLGQYSAAELDSVESWTIAPATDSSQFIDSLGATDELYGFVIWSPTAEEDAIAILQDAQSDGLIDGFYPLVNRQQNRRFIPNDPLFENQWHLQNTGQSGGVAGVDANVVPAWDSFTGEGVLIGIIDDGLQHTHPDLDDRYSAADSFDFNDNDADPSPGAGDPHGTSVAGVAAAVFENSLGVSGSAPDAGLAGLRLISGPVSDLDEATALTYSLQNIDIYNNSWGPFDDGTLGAPGPLTLQAFVDGVTNGRGGLGSIHTWAAGNGLGSNDNANYDAYANSRYTIAVAAIDHNGQQAPYSEPGAPILVTAPSNGAGVGIVTTDLLGTQGYNNGSGFSNDYTDNFGGTSSATPLVSGVIALMLEANPNLTWRDVQHILVQTAVQNDAADSDWTTNGAGRLVNHKYGFGMVDATAAVEAAQGWRTVTAERTYDSGTLDTDLAIPDNDSTGVSTTHSVDEDIIIESVEVIFDATHTYRGNLEVVLTSPSGTESILSENHSDSGNDFSSWSFTSMRHWDESSLGDWTLTVRDLRNQDVGTFDSWQLRMHGTDGIAALAIDVSPTSISENGGEAVATITRQFADLSQPLDVTLINSDPSELALESDVVTFDVGVETISVPITAVDDDLVDGSQFVTLTATAEGVLEGIATVEVVDFETFDLQLSADSLFENGDTVELTIIRQDLSTEATVVLESSRNDKLSLESEMVTLPVGVAEATVTLTGVDNQILDGTQPVQITVSSEHYVGGAVDIEVLDYEPLTIAVDETEISEKGGVANVVLSRPDTSFPLTVQLDVSPAGVVTSPTTVEFGIGQAESSFTVDAIDNSTLDNFRLVSVVATAPDHVSTEVDITVLDHEELEFILPVSSVPENGGVLQAQLRRSDPNGDATASLFSAAPSRLQLPPSVAFSDGNELSDPFDLVLRDNTLPDGSTTVALTATMFGFQLALAELEITDFEPLELTQLGGDVSEGAGEVLFRLTRPSPVSEAEIFLDGEVVRVFELPPSVRFEAGETQVVFAGTVIDDEFVRANPSITVTADSDTYVADSVTFEVIENDVPELTLELDTDALLEGTGIVSARLSRNTETELNAFITTDVPGILDLPSMVEFPAGRVFVDFEIGTIDDEVVSGTREVNLTINGIGHPVVMAPVTIADDEIAGFEFTGESIELTEGGVDQMVGLRLLTEPAAEVTVNLAINDTSQVNMTPTQLVFTPDNWDVPQDVVVEPIDDETVEPAQAFSIVASVSSTGPYAGLEDLTLPVFLEDDDVPLILLEETDDSTIVNEFDLDDSFTVRLGARPQSDVLIVIDGSEVSEAIFSPSELTFTPDNWDQDQVITVSTPLDFEEDRNQIGSVYVNVDPARSDAAYASAGQRIFALVQLDSVLNDLRVRTENDQLVLLEAASEQVLVSSSLGEPGGAGVTLGGRGETVVVETLSSDDVVISTVGGDDKISLDSMTGGLVDGGDGMDVVSLLLAGEFPAESAGGVRLRNIEHIDLSDPDQQILDLDAQDVQAITDELNTLTLTVGPEDLLSLSSTWTIGAPVLSEGVPTHSLTSDGVTIQLANRSIWQNPLNPFDIDRSGSASPSDALAAINRLAVQDDATLPFFPGSPDEHYFDVNGDGDATVRDALAIINHLAGLTNQTVLEGEATNVLDVDNEETETAVLLTESTLDDSEFGKACQWHAESVDQAVDEITQSDWLSDGEAEEEAESVFGPIWDPLA